MKKFFAGLLILTALLVCSLQAANRTIFIQNRLYKGPVATEENTVYIPLADFLNAMQLDLTQEDGAWKLYPQTQPVTRTEVTQNPCNFVFQDKHFGVFLLFRDNQAYIPLKSMATQMGALFAYNRDTGIIDINFVQAYTPSQAQAAATGTTAPAAASGSAPSASAASGTATEEEKPKVVPSLIPTGAPTSPYTTTRTVQDLVRVASFDYYQNDSPINTSEPYTIAQASQLRGVLKIKNCSDKPIDTIQTTIHFMDMYGSSDQPIDSQSLDTVTLASGETKEFDIYWNNNSVVRPNPDVEIKIPDKYLEKDKNK